MREKMILLWRKLTKIKVLTPFIKLIRYIAGTSLFNMILDFCEVKIFKTSYMDSREFMKQNWDRIADILTYLGDERSRIVYENIWKYRATHKREFLRGGWNF